MKKMASKFLLLKVSILLSMMGTNVYAHDIAVENDDGVTIYYNFIGQNELEVTYGPSKYKGNVSIPEELTFMDCKYKVTRIGEWAFSGCSNLISVNIPQSVTAIRKEAFKFSTSLADVNLPDGLSVLEDGVFTTCVSLTSITIPEGINKIYNDTFGNCSSLKSVTIKGSLSRIGERAFGSCSSLSNINFGGTVEIIDFAAFYNCSSLISIILPEGLTTIERNAFQNSGLESLTLPSSLQKIKEQAFDCDNLNSIISNINEPFEIEGVSSEKRVFKYITYKKAILQVPVGTKNKYKNTVGWKDFDFIEESTPSTIINIDSNKEIEKKRYTIEGRAINHPQQKGIHIIQMNDGTTKKVLVK